MRQYLRVMNEILRHGHLKSDRTGTGTKSVFGRQMRFNLQHGFPLVTTKKLHMKSIIHELLWFLNGDTNIKYLQDNGVRIWNEWADENGDLGPVYGKQWRSWDRKDGTAVDQIQTVMNALRDNPDSRRMIVVAFNPADVDDMALPPCHAMFQFYTRVLTDEERFVIAGTRGHLREVKAVTTRERMIEKLDELNVPKRAISLQLYQRSGDWFLGIPFNIASYALLLEMFAQQLNMLAEEFIHTVGDAHIYTNHFEQCEQQLVREPRALPMLVIKRKPDSIFDYKYEDFEFVDYDPHPAIAGKVAV